MRSVNKVILIGNLTRDPELKQTSGGKTVAVVGVATNRTITRNGETAEEPQYHRVVCWEKLGELAGQLLRKGRKVFVDGELRYRTYTDDEQQTRGVCEIVANDFVLLDAKRSGDDFAVIKTPATSEDGDSGDVSL
jgi:single-strand DNA-binding protein